MEPFGQIALIFSAAALFGWLSFRWRQPIIMAYLTTGFLLVSFGFLPTEDQALFSSFAKIGVSLLLFLVGLRLSLRDLRLVGPEAVRLGLGQIVITFLFSLLVSTLLGFGLTKAAFVSLALTLSSTIIVVKLLSEKRELVSLHGKLAIGLLLVQDLVVLLVMVFLASFSQPAGVSLPSLIAVLIKGVMLFLVTIWLARRPIPWLFNQLAGSTELLFVAAIGWCFTATSVAHFLGFSPEIGAFLAGIGLANAPVGFEIAAKVQPLRDFFLGIFFILLGAEMGLTLSTVNWLDVLVLTPVVLIIKPLVVWFMLIWMGYRRRTAFLSAIILGQISEFSLILVGLGQDFGLLSSGTIGTMVVVGVITIGISATLTHSAEKIYVKVKSYLWPAQRPVKEEIFGAEKELKGHLILLGCDRSGQTILPILMKMKMPLIVVDFNPAVIEHLTAVKVDTIYGDIGDEEILDKLNLTEAKVVISTVHDWHDSLLLLSKLESPDRPVVVLTAASGEDAIEFYNRGADYVIVPEIAGGEHLSSLLVHHRLARENWRRIGKHHYQRLINRR